MVEWKNLDTLKAYQELKDTERVNLAEVMSGENGAERVKTYSVPMAEGMVYNYAAKAVGAAGRKKQNRINLSNT